MSLVRSQCCLRGDVSLLETTELLTKLPAPDLFSIMRCEVSSMYINKMFCFFGLNLIISIVHVYF